MVGFIFLSKEHINSELFITLNYPQIFIIDTFANTSQEQGSANQ